jgi:hypothetical protein
MPCTGLHEQSWQYACAQQAATPPTAVGGTSTLLMLIFHAPVSQNHLENVCYSDTNKKHVNGSIFIKKIKFN